MKNAGKPWRLGGPWTREFDTVENLEWKPYLLSEGRRQRLGDSSTRRNASHGQNMYQSCQLKLQKDIANEHAAVFTDNSSSAHYSATFQAIKEQEEKVKIDFTTDNTEVYNKPFRLRDLRQSIMKAKPRAPGPDGIHNNLLKQLPEDTLNILKEILNRIWISADLPQQWRAATVIPIPKPNKDHTDPLSYRPIALTSCLCKVLEGMINTRLIWYLEKYRILDRSQCGFRKHPSMTYHLVSLERYLRDAFAQRQQTVGLFFDLEKAYETTWQYGIIQDLHKIGLRGRLPVFVSEYLRDRRIRFRIGTTLMNSTQRKVFQLAVSWLWHALDWRLTSCPLVLPRTSSEHSLSMTWRSVIEDAPWTP